MKIIRRMVSSIQMKIALTTGLCIFVIMTLLIAGNVISGIRTNDYATDEVMGFTDEQIKDSLLNRASSEAGVIRAELDVGLHAARTMAKTFAVLADDASNGTPASDRRAQFNAVLRHVLEQNPTLNGTYSAWEPDALDHNDAAYKDRRDEGSDATGRFLPYWTKDAAGKGRVQPLVEYDSYEMASYGLKKGAWYIDPKATGREKIIGPQTYLDQGKQVSLATVAVPVMIDGRFRGIAGANFNVNFVQDLATQVNASLFKGQGKVAIISDLGLIVADSADAAMVGKKASEADPRWADSLAVVNGKPVVQEDPSSPNIDVYAPIRLSATETPWAVVISIPRAVAFETVNKLGTDLADREASNTFWQIGGGLVVAFGAIFLIAITARGIAKPIERITASMKRLASGDVASDVPYTDRAGEIGEMAAAVQSFKEAAIEKIRLSEDAEHARLRADTERASNEAVKAKQAEEQSRAVNRLGDGLRNLAVGDLTARLDEGFSENYIQIRNDFNDAIGKLKDTMLAVVASTGAIHSGTQEISTAADDLSRRTEQQAASLEETAAALNEITTTAKKAAEGANHARDVVSAADGDAKKSAVVVREAVGAIASIAKSSQQISQIIGVIDEIAFQTNLLALNAGVEAARAGDAGRGFAVVASEVRALAQRSAEAAKEIKGLIQASSTQVEHGVRLVNETGKSLERIMQQVTEITVIVSQIAAGAKEQSAALGEVNAAINQMDQVTQQNAAMVEETTAASHSLSQETEQLAGLIGQFQVSPEGSQASGRESLRRELQKAAPHAFQAPKAAGNGGLAEARKPARPARARVANGATVSTGEDGWTQF